MKRLFCMIPLWMLLAGCSKKTDNRAGDGTPLDTYRQGINRAQEVQKKSDERTKALDSISQEGQGQ